VPWYITVFAVHIAESLLSDMSFDRPGPVALATNTIFLWPLSVILGKRLQDRGIPAKRYVIHARMWFLLLSATLAAGMFGDNRLFFALFGVVMVYQLAFLMILMEVMQSFLSPGQDHENEFGPPPAS